MKRSEMITKLATKISWIGHGYYTSDECSRMADNLLSFLEEEGMRPHKPKLIEHSPPIDTKDWDGSEIPISATIVDTVGWDEE